MRYVIKGLHCIYFCLLDLTLYVPVNDFSDMSWRVFLGWTSTKQGLMCLAKGHNSVTLVRLEPTTPWVESSTLPQSSLKKWIMLKRDNFTKELLENDHFMVIFQYFLCKTSWNKNLGATTWLCYIQIPVIMRNVIKWLHCIYFCLFHLTLYVPVNNFFSYVRTGLPGLNQY